MSAKRDQRKKRGEEKSRRQRNEKQSLLFEFFGLLGLQDRLSELPDPLIERLAWRVNPKPVVTVGDALQDDDEAHALHSELSTLLEVEFDLDEMGIPASVSASSLLRVGLTMEESLAETTAIMKIVSRKVRNHRELAKRSVGMLGGLLESFRSSRYNQVLGFLTFEIDFALNRRLSLCERAYAAGMDLVPTQGGRLQATLRISKHVPKPVRVPTASGDRRAYEVGKTAAFRYEVVRWDRAKVGLGGSGQAPVLVLKHAVERLEQRLPWPEKKFWLHRLMVDSLAKPRIARADGDTLLVEFRIGDLRLGYFVAEKVADAVLVRTFKFLTMQGTPEGEKLRSVLGLRRPDIEYLNLDDFSGLAFSDFQEDPALSRLFEECGCGHLISLLRPEVRNSMLHSRSSDLKRYIGMAEGSGGSLANRAWKPDPPPPG